jgi:hypothetical protein
VDRLRLFDALSRMRLRRLADHHPVVIVLDDLQWADAGSLRLLRFLAADLARSRLLCDRHAPRRRRFDGDEDADGTPVTARAEDRAGGRRRRSPG